MFNKLYKHYQNTFDLEMRLHKANVTYAELHEKQMQDEEWL
jgi:hypothetical protein